MPVSSLYPSDSRKTQPDLLAQSALSQIREFELLRWDGVRIPVEVSASATELAGKPAILGMFRDIRERRNAAAELRRSEDRFSYLIQNLSDVITRRRRRRNHALSQPVHRKDRGIPALGTSR